MPFSFNSQLLTPMLVQVCVRGRETLAILSMLYNFECQKKAKQVYKNPKKKIKHETPSHRT